MERGPAQRVHRPDGGHRPPGQPVRGSRRGSGQASGIQVSFVAPFSELTNHISERRFGPVQRGVVSGPWVWREGLAAGAVFRCPEPGHCAGLWLCG